MVLTATLYDVALYDVAPNEDERRAAPRRAIGQVTTVRQSGAPLTVILHDLSEAGALIETDADLQLDAPVTVGLPGVGRFHAHVVNKSEDRYGCRFDEPLPPGAAMIAFRHDPVLAGPFDLEGVATQAAFVEAPVQKWHGSVRIAIPVVLSLSMWAVILHALGRVVPL